MMEKKNINISIFILLICFIVVMAIGYARSVCRPVPTVDGPEASHLISQTRGFILLEEYRETKPYIKIISLPSLHEKAIQVPSESIFSLSGPDELGRIAYISGKLYRRIKLGITTMEGEKHEIIFSQNGNFLDLLSMGSSLAISPKNGYVAISKQVPPRSENDIVQIWDIATKRLVVEFPGKTSSKMPWFSDGTRLAYTKEIYYWDEIPLFNSYSKERQKFYSSKGRITAVFIYDLRNNTHIPFHTGWNPVVSPDDRSMLIVDHVLKSPESKRKYASYLVNIENKEDKIIDWPGRHEQITAFIEPDVILYKGLITTGKVAETVVDSPLWGPKIIPSVKIANLTTSEFQTIIDTIEPRGEISYGRVSTPK